MSKKKKVLGYSNSMEKWRRILWLGMILGIIVSVIDFLVEGISYVIIVPLEIVAIILIFAGFIIRKIEKMREKESPGGANL